LIKLTPPPMVASEAEWQRAIEAAYDKQNRRIGFTEPEDGVGRAG
jgi:hypothetical protein